MTPPKRNYPNEVLVALALIATLAGCQSAPETAQSLPKQPIERKLVQKDDAGWALLGSVASHSSHKAVAALVRNDIKFVGSSREMVDEIRVKREDRQRAFKILIADSDALGYTFRIAER